MAERRAKDDKKAAKEAALGVVVPTVVDDEAALRQQAKQRAEQNRALLQNMYAHPERLADLRRLEQERVQLDRDRKLGLKSKSDTGVRFETRYL